MNKFTRFHGHIFVIGTMIIASLVLSRCSLKPGETSIVVKVPPFSGSNGLSRMASKNGADSKPGPIEQMVGIAGGPPETAAGFNCLIVNVVGEGIAPAFGSHGLTVLGGLMSGASYCSYPGVISDPIPNSAEEQNVKLTVPMGTKRLVQLIGIMDSTGTACNGSAQALENSNIDAFEIGRATFDVLGTGVEVNLSGTYNSLNYNGRLNRMVTCGTAGFSPTAMSSLKAWFKPDGISPQTSVNAITGWSNSGNYSLGSATPVAGSPTPSTSPSFGGSYLSAMFTGGAFLQGSPANSHFDSTTNGITILGALKTNTVPVSAVYDTGIFTAGNGTYYHGLYLDANSNNLRIESSADASDCVLDSAAVLSNSQSYVIGGKIKIYSSGTNASVFLNGNENSATLAACTTPQISSTNFYLIGNVSPTQGPSTNSSTNMTIAEILFFNSYLSDADVRDLRCYLAHKYNITAAQTGC